MTEYFSETQYFNEIQTLAAVPSLSRAQLGVFLAEGLIAAHPSPEGAVFRAVDVARLALLCDLAEHFDLQGDALAVVIALIDQLHITRQHLRAMAQALEVEPQDLRARVGARFIGLLAV
jgi:chaperone modulatory protein CbpM